MKFARSFTVINLSQKNTVTQHFNEKQVSTDSEN